MRFVTKKFIGDYDPNLEKMYTYQVTMESETVNFEILDTAGYVQDVSENMATIIYHYIINASALCVDNSQIRIEH